MGCSLSEPELDPVSRVKFLGRSRLSTILLEHWMEIVPTVPHLKNTPSTFFSNDTEISLKNTTQVFS